MRDPLQFGRGRLVVIRARLQQAQPKLRDHHQRHRQPHRVDRGMPADATPMNGARACWAIIASGDPSPPTPIRRQPRRTASARGGDRLLGAAGARYGDHQVSGTHPGGQLVIMHREDLGRAARPADGGQHVAYHPGAPHAGDHDRPGPVRVGDLHQVRFLGGPHGGPHLRGRRGHLAEHVGGVSRRQQRRSVQALLRVRVHRHPASLGRRASSTSSTGMSSRTG